MNKPEALVIVGHGINCDRELANAFKRAGAVARRVHLKDLVEDPNIDAYQIVAFPGGFSFGDDTFAGNIFAKLVKYNGLRDSLRRHLDKGRLVIGICNGNQIGTVLNLVPVFEGYFDQPEFAFTYNNSARYEDRGVNLRVVSHRSKWLKSLDLLRDIPIGHGEGKFYATTEVLEALKEHGLVALKYVNADGSPANDVYPANPNGSLEDIAGIASYQVLLMMPHPERAILPYNQPGWTRRKSLLVREGIQMPEEGDGMKIIRNGVEYAKTLI
jgi:phosphoribosylformylglycinamidine synthase